MRSMRRTRHTRRMRQVRRIAAIAWRGSVTGRRRNKDHTLTAPQLAPPTRKRNRTTDIGRNGPETRRTRSREIRIFFWLFDARQTCLYGLAMLGKDLLRQSLRRVTSTHPWPHQHSRDAWLGNQLQRQYRTRFWRTDDCNEGLIGPVPRATARGERRPERRQRDVRRSWGAPQSIDEKRRDRWLNDAT